MRASRVRKPGLLEPLTELDVVFDQRARDAEAQRAGLAGDAAAGDRREHVELVGRFGHQQRVLDLGAKRFGGEGLLDRLAIDDRSRRLPGLRNTRAVDVLRRPVP